MSNQSNNNQNKNLFQPKPIQPFQFQPVLRPMGAGAQPGAQGQQGQKPIA